ncbi:MAG: hypothetical protein MI824_07825 [Hyphomicrobiales bacterium]|nr:hypothetical protein [Hyphomicrobiales bacterium]
MKADKRTVFGTVVYVLTVCAAYGIARGIGALTGWTDPWAQVGLSLAAFVGLIMLLAVAYDRFRSDEG